MPKKKAHRKILKSSLKPKNCYFCENKKIPSLEEVSDLSKFLTERGKIIPASRSGLCAKHQRQLTRSIKHARYLGLLSFVVRG